MKLDYYLWSNRIKGKVFAKEVGISESYLSALRRHSKWPGRKIMHRIIAATNGQVTVNDFAEIEEETTKDEKRV